MSAKIKKPPLTQRIPSIRYFLRIIRKFSPPDRILTFGWIRNIVIAYILIIGPMVGYSLYRISKEPEKKEGDETEVATSFTPMVKVFRAHDGGQPDDRIRVY